MAGLLEKIGLMRIPPPARPITAHADRTGADAPVKNAPRRGTVTRQRRADHQGYIAGDLTPDRIKAILNATLYGSPRDQNDAFDRMLERDAHVACEYGKRLMAIGRLEWDIRSASQVREGDLSEADTARADEIAAYVRAVLSRITVVGHGIESPLKIGAGLAHLNDAIGRGLAGVEMEWDNVSLRIPGGKNREPRTLQSRIPVRWHCLAPGRWRRDDQEPWRLRILVDENDYRGLALDELPPGKFIIHAPRSIGGSAFRGALHIPALLMFFGKSYGWRWLLVAVEIFGKPTRYAKVPSNAPDSEWDAALAMLKDLGDGGAGVFDEHTSIEIESSTFTAGGNQSLYERLLKICDANVSKNYIGNATTTEVQTTGGGVNSQPTLKADEVREDIRDNDLAAESATITEQCVKVIVRASLYANDDESLWPEFIRLIPEALDDLRDMEILDRAVRLGKKITAGFVNERFGLPLAGDEQADTVLEAPAASFDPYGIGAGDRAAGKGLTANREQIRLVAHSALDKIRRRPSAIAKLIPWIAAASLASQAHSEQVVARFSAALAANDELRMTNGETAEAAVSRLLSPELVHVFSSLTEDLQELVRQSLLAAQLAGRAEAQSRIQISRVQGIKSSRVQAHADGFDAGFSGIDFARLPFPEAINSLRDRIGLKPDEFLKLDREARSRAWRVAGVWDMDLLAVLHTNLVQSIANGESVRDFRNRVLPSMLDRDGWTGEQPWHADLVFFQNFKMAHSAGSYRQMVESEVPYFRTVANGESCPICQPEIGRIYKITDASRMDPFHFGCDCDHEPVFADEIDAADVNDSTRDPSEGLDAERARPSGFQYDVRQYAALDPIPLSKFPSPYHAALRDFAGRHDLEVAP